MVEKKRQRNQIKHTYIKRTNGQFMSPKLKNQIIDSRYVTSVIYMDCKVGFSQLYVWTLVTLTCRIVYDLPENFLLLFRHRCLKFEVEHVTVR